MKRQKVKEEEVKKKMEKMEKVIVAALIIVVITVMSMAAWQDAQRENRSIKLQSENARFINENWALQWEYNELQNESQAMEENLQARLDKALDEVYGTGRTMFQNIDNRSMSVNMWRDEGELSIEVTLYDLNLSKTYAYWKCTGEECLSLMPEEGE